MSLIIEDGSITVAPYYVVGANSYVSTATFTAYCAARNYTIVASDPTYLLIKAMDYLETQVFIGVKRTRDQPLQWPRYYVIIDTWWVNPTTIPQLLQDAQCEIAIAIDQGYDPLAVLPRDTKRIKVDDIEVEYQLGSNSLALARTINNKLWKLLKGGINSGNCFRVGKA